VTERMFGSYENSADKRFLTGVISESARAVSNLIKAFLIRERVGGKSAKKNLRIFMENVAPRYLDKLTRENLFKILEVERAQKNSPIEYMKDGKLILLIEGKYRFLTAQRVKEFVESVKDGVGAFQKDFRQI